MTDHIIFGAAHEDERGRIQDLVYGPLDAATRISTAAGHIRGNHLHHRTRQWTYLLSGRLLVHDGQRERVLKPGEMVEHSPGTPHAWKALEDADCLVFSSGPRAGADYESDTYRLEKPLLS